MDEWRKEIFCCRKIMKYIKIYTRLLSMGIKNELEYRFNFLVGLFVELVWMSLYFVFYRVIFYNTNILSGWNYGEALVFVGTSKLFTGLLYGTFVIWNLRRLPFWVSKGELDSFLLKPLNSQWHVSMGRPYPLSFFALVLPLLFIVFGFKNLGYMPNIVEIGASLIILTCGLLMAYAVWFSVMMVVFWTNRAHNASDLVDEVIAAVNYPSDIFHGASRLFFTFIVPAAFMTTFPAKALLGSVNWWWLPLGLALTATMLFVSSKLWNFALKHYTGASA